jgi:indolepyruvate ferredoxin oxidoreductase alpha subunit
MCAGCPHRGIFYQLKRMKLTVTGDIGCYTLAAGPPLDSMDTCICMGASIGVAHGMEKAMGRNSAKKRVAVLGESTFIHSGITGLINVVYNRSAVTTIILDNSITAMTGQQHNPASGFDAKGHPAPVLDLEAIVRACGVEKVFVVNPFDQVAVKAALTDALTFDGPAVIIAKKPCVFLNKTRNNAWQVNIDDCIGCKICLNIGCPALGQKAGKAFIEPKQCIGCSLCGQVCPKKAIHGEEA